MRTPTKVNPALIVIADQDDDERCLLRAMLKLKGFNVIEARDGREAVEVAIDKRPDLLVMDLKLPRVSGSAAIRQIRKRADLRNLPIVAVSSARSKRGSAGQSTAHLNKPIEYSELDELLDRFLPGRRLSLTRG
jgi:CheY-like chemotaxis protein